MSKEEVLKKYDDSVVSAKEQMYDDAHAEGKAEGFAEGQASVGMTPPEDTTPFDQAYVDQKIAEATAGLSQAITDLQLEESKEEGLRTALESQLAAIKSIVMPASAEATTGL
jgi:flagellar biosynthesis/type III secretory pathway protein FliH